MRNGFRLGRYGLIAVLCGLLAGMIPAVALAAAPAPITEAGLRRHIAILADDDMAGRRPGTPGGDKATAYVIAQMQGAGLSAGFAGGGGWSQPVPLVERGAGTGVLKAGGLSLGAGDVLLLPRDPAVRIDRAPLIFLGYGDGGGTDLHGAAVVLLARAPTAAGARPLAERRAAVTAAGAAAVLVPIAAGAPWAAVEAQYRGRMASPETPQPAVQGVLSASAWIRLARAVGRDAADLATRAAAPGFAPVGLGSVGLSATGTVRTFASANVIGRIPGTSRAGEAIAVVAHWDHLGLCGAADAPDRICNGAVDNASGVALMLEMARVLAAGPRPARTILFVATTAEEQGLLGARWLAAHAPLPIRAAVILDTVAIAPRGAPVAVIGRGMTGLDPLIDAAAAAVGRKVDPGTERNVLVTRQDGWALMQAGIPAIMAGGGFADLARLNRFLAGAYHGPKDDLAGIELGGAAEDGAFLVALLRMMADAPDLPAIKR